MTPGRFRPPTQSANSGVSCSSSGPTAVDVYESTELHSTAAAAVGPLELQLTPLFAD